MLKTLNAILQSTFVVLNTIMLLPLVASAATFTTSFFSVDGNLVGELTFSAVDNADSDGLIVKSELIGGAVEFEFLDGFVDFNRKVSIPLDYRELYFSLYLNPVDLPHLNNWGEIIHPDLFVAWDEWNEGSIGTPSAIDNVPVPYYRPLRPFDRLITTQVEPDGQQPSTPSPASTAEPSLILGFITVGGLMLGSRKKEKA